jgi:hypothetical protein
MTSALFGKMEPLDLTSLFVCCFSFLSLIGLTVFAIVMVVRHERGRRQDPPSDATN